MALGYVYDIYDKRTEESVYVGSTAKHYMERWGKHLVTVFMPRDPRRGPVHIYMLAEGPEHFGIRVREEVFWKTKLDLLKREQVWMDELKPKCNVKAAYVTEERRKKLKSACGMRWNAKKVLCECGVILRQGYLWEHRKTAKHLAILLKAKHS